MLLADQRIEIDARPAPPPAPVLEVVMLGHCPAPSGVEPGWQRVASNPAMLDEIAGLGLNRSARRLRQLLDGAGVEQAGDADLRQLYGVPIPLHSLGQFRVIFPYSFDTPARYQSALAGDRAWLPQAVQDFFEGSRALQQDLLKLWVIRVPETPGAAAFLPDADADLTDPETLSAFGRALLVRRAGILALPDLERLQVPARLPDIPRLRMSNAPPVFLPCGVTLDDGHRERRNPDEIPDSPEPLPADRLVGPIARSLARLRPDLQCLLALPFDVRQTGERPAPSRAFRDYLEGFSGRSPDEALSTGDAPSALRHLQFIYPYLRSADRPLSSPSGIVAGIQALVSQAYGPWRSIGERPLPDSFRPWPPLSQGEATALRDKPGITVLLHRAGKNVVDDERLCVPCLPLVALRQLTAERRAHDHWRSAEIVRFMGWLQRELRQLGEGLVFDADIHDPRPELALRTFFTHLHALGALRGALPERAFRIEKRTEGESTLIFDIEIAPAFPVDLIRITFLQDRHGESTRAEVEAVDG